MKTIPALICFILSLFLLVSCSRAPKGDIILPAAGEIRQVVIRNGDTSASSSDGDTIGKLLDQMGQAKDTGRESVQDHPVGDAAVKIEFVLQNNASSVVYLYFNGGKLFLEQPYQGIYSIDKSFANTIHEIGQP